MGIITHPPIHEKDQGDENDDLRNAFRRAFEAKFKPLEGITRQEKMPDRIPELEWEDEREGLSDGDKEPRNTVEVIEVDGSAPMQRLAKAEIKAFMSSTPPTHAAKTPAVSNRAKSSSADDDTDTDALNLKHDLALQRLLRESHLLDPSSPNALLTGPVGKNRHKATDLRVQALGSKSSILAQAKMPMAHRRGIKAKAVAREAARRRVARENGIVLEKQRRERNADAHRKRDRGVGAPAVGRFSGGTLHLSKIDVAGLVTGMHAGKASRSK